MPVLLTDLPPGQRIPRLLPGLESDEDLGPASPSLDHMVMQPYWFMTRDILLGLDALKAGAEVYLPKHPEEQATDYKYRLDNAVLTNIYADIIETLAAKPFDEELKIVDGSASEVFIGTPITRPDPKNNGKPKDTGARKGGLVEDIDGKGNHLHVFAHDVFYNGINAGVDFIFVDFPKNDTARNVRAQRAQNIRPYWYRVPALHVLELQSAMVGGKEEIIYTRILEFATSRKDGQFKTEVKTRVREIVRDRITDADGMPGYSIPKWKLYELQYDEVNKKRSWSVIENGEYSIGVIPLVPFICGKREGSSWVIRPPMKSAATLQIELYQQETGLKNVSNLVYYPMLSASGVNLVGADGKPVKIVIGPHSILSAPPAVEGGEAGKWEFIEPTAESGKFVAGRIETLKNELRELGRQPLTAQSSGITVISAAFASQKANSALMAWTLMLKDALENALLLTAKWLNLAEEPEVQVDTDFVLEMDKEGATLLSSMRTSRDLSQRTYWEEMKRKGVLSPEFDADAEEKALAAEMPSDDDLIAAGGGQGDNPPQDPKDE